MVFQFPILTLALCLALAAASCGRKLEAPAEPASQETPRQAEADAIGLDLAAIDPSIDPGDDFYGYANGRWLRRFELPEERSSYGVATQLAERVVERVVELVESIDPRAPAGSAERKVRDFYLAFRDVAVIEAKGMAPLAPEFAAIDAIKTPAEAAALYFNPARGSLWPIAPAIGVDPKDPNRHAVFLVQFGLGLEDRSFYLEERHAARRLEYRRYAERLMAAAGAPDPRRAADRIVAFETTMAAAHWEERKRRNRDLTYNPKTIDELQSFAPHAPWREMLATAGLLSPRSFILREDEAVAQIAEIVAAAPMETLRDYLKFHLIDNYAEVLPEAVRAAKADFLGAGARERAREAAAAVDAALGEALGRLYVERHFPPETKAQAEAICADLIAALDARLAEPLWMSESTRAKAKEKLARLAAKIGHPETWRNYGDLAIMPGDAFGNARRARQFAWRADVNRLAEPVDRTRWRVTPQTVDAFYGAASNELVFPAAIFAPPLFDPEADLAVNYGAVGAAIGHELIHGFDSFGRRSDADGVLNDWWSTGDSAQFDAMLGSLAFAFPPAPTVQVSDAALAELAADVAGLALAYDAYRRAVQGRAVEPRGDLSGDQRFFLAYAQSMRRATRRGSDSTADVGPHAPAAWRVNVAVRNIDAWYEAFEVDPGDALWLAAADRTRIW
jgi:predicted metalloendopeptidase